MRAVLRTREDRDEALARAGNAEAEIIEAMISRPEEGQEQPEDRR
jgi:hypothetical protein